MMIKFAVAALAMFAMLDDKAKDEKAKTDQDAVQGSWKVESTEQGGTKSAPNGDVVITMKGDSYVLKMGGSEVEKGTFKLDSTKKPKTIDFKIVEGNDKGKNQVGIYSLEGDTFKICVAQPETKDRPKELATKDGSDDILFVLKREKK